MLMPRGSKRIIINRHQHPEFSAGLGLGSPLAAHPPSSNSARSVVVKKVAFCDNYRAATAVYLHRDYL